MAISKRLVLRSGFSIIIGLLIVSTVMAWRIQESFSKKSAEIHRAFVEDQEVLTSLRRLLGSVGSAVRDYYLDPAQDAAAFEKQMTVLRDEGIALFDKLRKGTDRPEAIAALELQVSELWSMGMKAPSLTDSKSRFQFLRQEIVQRRNEAGRVLREVERANHSSLAISQEQFQAERTGAARRLLALLGISLLCGVIVAFLSTRYSERLEREAMDRFSEVSEAKLQLEHLSARLMEIQEEERTRISRELHDEIVQNLAVLKMEIAEAQSMAARNPAAVLEPLGRARRLAETTVQTIRNITLLLRPSLLDDLGLAPALQWQTEEFTRRTGVPCDFVGEVGDDLPDAIKTCVYRVTQEALRNCEKHSGATQVRVTVSEKDNALEVTVEDNGSGFKQDKVRKPTSLGVLGMRERAAGLGGTLQTFNRPEGGAVVNLRLPVARKSAPMLEVHV